MRHPSHTAALVSLLLLFLATSCGGREEKRRHSHHISDSDSSLTRRAWHMREIGEPIEKCMQVQALAVKELREGRSYSDPVEVLEQAGFFHYLAGNLDTALKYYAEAADSLVKQPLAGRGNGAIQLFGDISLLYSRMGMPAKSLQYNDSALDESRRQGGAMITDVYTFRAGIYLENGHIAQRANATLRHSPRCPGPRPMPTSECLRRL